MTGYRDNQGRLLFVSAGLGGDIFGTFYRKPNRALKRVVSPALPMVPDKMLAQIDLDKWAASKGFDRVEIPSQ